ncbi:cell division cycle 7-related protein kinase [Macrosteles quadrilineatus]|uniref:cell division cycle 7-related protein kinase n=1 Tax=Macrosteles quadrilineatus TaxID=74068 RepID=UPI0023E23A6C|nr:cell division cycle 7-related protein kinase [Macrosteles quadrilineatus]
MDDSCNYSPIASKVSDPANVGSKADCSESFKSRPRPKHNDNDNGFIKGLLNRLPELDNSFDLIRKVGEGTFSNVYLATLKGRKDKRKFAIKHLIPTTHPRRVKYELDCMIRMGGKDNVVSCEATIRQDDCIVFIMPYLQHQKFADYVFDMTVEETRLYMKNLLIALKRVHSFNIIHRDVKPGNFLYNRENKKFLLVDFGLAQKSIDRSSTALEENNQTACGKRKREDDDSENMERPVVKRSALQTLPLDVNRQEIHSSANILKFSKQPLSIQQQKCQSANAALYSSRPLVDHNKPIGLHRKPLSSNPSNVLNNTSDSNQTFQSLATQIKNISVDKGTSFVRVQNSQVQTGQKSLFPRPTAPVPRNDVCDCYRRARICNTCITRKALNAPRAGTPGFRPPEVLLKYPYQTTAVDIWAAGVMMLCILSGCYPFFRSPDDITALSELITIFGSSAIVNLARKLGRNVICSENRKPVNPMILCEFLRRRKIDGEKPQPGQPLCEECKNAINEKYGCLCESKCKLDLSNTLFPRSAFDLLCKLLDLNPETRITAEKALQHPFINGSS